MFLLPYNKHFISTDASYSESVMDRHVSTAAQNGVLTCFTAKFLYVLGTGR